MQTHHRQSFIDAFVRAVVAYQKADLPQSITWDGNSESFLVDPVEPGTTPEDVDFYVGSTWTNWIGSTSIPAGAYTAVGQPMDEARLAEALHEAVAASGKAEWMFNIMLEVMRARQNPDSPAAKPH